MSNISLEPLVTEEQGVVYLFSRYWDMLKRELNLEKAELESVGSRFPDAKYYQHDKLGGIEFEYKLSGFREHLSQLVKYTLEHDLPLMVIYWIDDAPKIKNIKNVKFINLSQFFSCITRNIDGQFIPFLSFDLRVKQRSHKPKYTLTEMMRDYNKLKKYIKVEYGQIDNYSYRILPHNPAKAFGININHWQCIHLYPTKSKVLHDLRLLPKLILFKSADKNYINMIVKPTIVFTLKKTKINEPKVTEFFEKYYFNIEPSADNRHIIYNKVWLVNEARGKKLFKLACRDEKAFLRNGFSIHKDKDKKAFMAITSLTKAITKLG